METRITREPEGLAKELHGWIWTVEIQWSVELSRVSSRAGHDVDGIEMLFEGVEYKMGY